MVMMYGDMVILVLRGASVLYDLLGRTAKTPLSDGIERTVDGARRRENPGG